MPVILALERLRGKDQKLEGSLGYIGRPVSKSDDEEIEKKKIVLPSTGWKDWLVIWGNRIKPRLTQTGK